MSLFVLCVGLLCYYPHGPSLLVDLLMLACSVVPLSAPVTTWLAAPMKSSSLAFLHLPHPTLLHSASARQTCFLITAAAHTRSSKPTFYHWSGKVTVGMGARGPHRGDHSSWRLLETLKRSITRALIRGVGAWPRPLNPESLWKDCLRDPQ